MTNKNDNNEKTEADDSNDAKNPDSNKADVAEKLKTMGVMPSANKEPDTKERKFSPLLITMLLAIPAAAIITYMVMPEKFSNILAFNSNTTSTSDSPDLLSSNISTEQPQQPVYPVTDNWSRPSQANWNQRQEPEWVKQKRAEMEKRRADYQRQNPDAFPTNWNSSEPPEPPQWVKDQQAKMEQEMARYQQEWSNRSNNMPYNNRAIEPPAYMRHPAMNSYQPQNTTMEATQPQMQQNPNPGTMYPQMQGQQMPNPVNGGYPQGQMQPPYNTYNNYRPYPYFNAPNYGYGPYNAPYGWYGHPIR